MARSEIKQPLYIRGFTLIELMVVLSLIATLGALVGPAVMERLEKVQAQAETKQIIQLVEKLSYQAFLSGQDITLELDRFNCRYYFSELPSDTKSMSFEHLQFPEQILKINSNGFVNTPKLEYRVAGVMRELSMTEVTEL